MNSVQMPWYVRWVVGVGAWVTALVLIALGATFVFALLEVKEPIAMSLIGAVYLGFGLWFLRQDDAGVFAQQLGLATAAAGTALIVGGIGVESESSWVAFIIAAGMLAVVIASCDDKILQFLVAALAASLCVAALLDSNTRYAGDLAALATPVGLYLLLRPPQRDLMPTAIALILTYPLLSVFALDAGYLFRGVDLGGQFARALHIVLFLGLAYLHWRHTAGDKAKRQTVVFAVVATLVCLLLPVGGSAAMLILMLAFVTGSKPFALLGVALQAQFIVRYYYSLEVNLLNKSLLLMAVGIALLASWWLMHRVDARGKES